MRNLPNKINLDRPLCTAHICHTWYGQFNMHNCICLYFILTNYFNSTQIQFTKFLALTFDKHLKAKYICREMRISATS